MKFIRTQTPWPLALMTVCLLAACGGSDTGPGAGSPEILDSLTPPSDSTSGTDSVDRPEPPQTQVLLLTSDGKPSRETLALESKLSEASLTYREATFLELNAISIEDLAKVGLILWPGGNLSTQARALTQQTRDHVKLAVLSHGVGFLGLGAGAWAAGGASLGLGLVQERLSLFEPKHSGRGAPSVKITFQDGRVRTMAWREGPELGAWGYVLGRYADGRTAVAEGRSGKGRVLLSGPEPTKANLDLVVSWIQSILNPSRP